MSVQVGAHYLEKEQGGRGVLLGGVPGVAPAKVAILGGGVAGVNAAQMATGMRADVTIYDINNDRLAELDMFFSSQIKTALCVARGDRPGRRGGGAGDRRRAGPRRRRAQAGHPRHAEDHEARACWSTSPSTRAAASRPAMPTTHADPVYVVDGVIHYCVANMPGAVARTSAFALNNATLPFALKLANLGAEKAMAEDPHLANGLNVSGGKIRHQAVAEALDLTYDAA